MYRAVADLEPQPQRAEIYRRLAAVEESHAAFWRKHLEHAGAPQPELRPSWRTRFLILVAKRFGPDLVLPTLGTLEQIDRDHYDRQPESERTAMPAQERSHARVLARMSGAVRTAWDGSFYASLEGRHGAGGGNALRAAVLGANDGLVSNLSLVMGVAGASLGGREIVITGLAGLLAGAGSMALGEWLSVTSSRELYEKQIGIEEQEIQANPAEEAEELALIYEAKGLPAAQAKEVAARLMQSEGSALDTLAREELGIDPKELGGSALQAAMTSFVLFAVGAILPVLAFFFLSGDRAIVASLVTSGIGLFAIGAAITVLTGRSVWFSGARQVLVGLGAAALTFAIGRLIGVSLS